jgi:hypothetical protein
VKPDLAPSEVTTIRVDIATARVSANGRTWQAPKPTDLLSLIAAEFSGGWVQLAPPSVTPDARGLATALELARRRGADAVLGRCSYLQGGLSPLLQRPAGLAYQPVAPGTLLVKTDVLAQLDGRSLSSVWDEHWIRDIALQLWWSASITGVDLTVAHDTRPKSNIVRLSPQRAALHGGAPQPDAKQILIYGRIGASTSLYFDALTTAFPGSLRYLEPGDIFSDLPWLAAAGLVVIVRGFEFAQANGGLDLLAELGTPVVWFTDDDFMALGSETAALGSYDEQTVQTFCSRLAAVVTTSGALTTRLASLHPKILTLPPTVDEALLRGRPPAHDDNLAAVIGGQFRAASLTQHIAPAAQRAGLQLCVSSAIGMRPPGSRVQPFSQDFRQFVASWQLMAPGLLLHPYGDTGNIGNKSVGTILCAAYLGAVPLVGDEPAYAQLGEADGVLKATRDPEDWHRQLLRLQDRALRETLRDRVQTWARDACALDNALPAFSQLLELSRPGGTAADERMVAAVASKALQRSLPRQPRLMTRAKKMLGSAQRRLTRLRRRRG